MVELLVREGVPGTRCLTGPQVSAPSATKKRRAPNTAAENTSTSTRPKTPELTEHHGEGVHEDHLDVEDDEDHRDQVEADRKTLWGLDLGDDPALVGRQLCVRGSFVRCEHGRRDKRSGREQDAEDEESKY